MLTWDFAGFVNECGFGFNLGITGSSSRSSSRKMIHFKRLV
jgi:hypothetical protein